MAIELAISNWSGWTPSSSVSPVRIAETPDVSSIPTLLRRRLNMLGRACATEIMRHIHDGDNLPIVFCSRHGDIERTFGILTDLARNEPVSPMNFSLSVHNAIAGVISIHLGISANISSIAALEEGLVPVLLEAVGLLDDEQNKVLCVLGDVPLPEIYRKDCLWPDTPFVVCFTVSTQDGLPLCLDMEHQQFTPDSASSQQPSLEPLKFVEFLASAQQSLTTPHNGGWWTIRKRGQTCS
ncbi:MAG: beta-ketoacyl synthase chain length factor [Gammaproteobacteria bacterium]|jgi:hypothetical protein